MTFSGKYIAKIFKPKEDFGKFMYFETEFFCESYKELKSGI